MYRSSSSEGVTPGELHPQRHIHAALELRHWKKRSICALATLDMRRWPALARTPVTCTSPAKVSVVAPSSSERTTTPSPLKFVRAPGALDDHAVGGGSRLLHDFERGLVSAGDDADAHCHLDLVAVGSQGGKGPNAGHALAHHGGV